MNSKIFALIGLLLVTSCDTQPNVRPPVGDSTGLGTDGVLKSQEAIATEILSIQYTVGDAMFQLNNTNAIGFVAKVEPLADRLEKISKSLSENSLFFRN
jgi:hypothetical protein